MNRKVKKNVPQKNKEELQFLKGQLARALADYDNLNKRVEKEKYDYERLANLRLIVKLLPVLDMLWDAQKHLEDAGIAITIKEFEDCLKEEGLEKISTTEGSDFNEKFHEAIDTVNGGKQGTIAESVLAGWRYLNGLVIRHEKVKVYKGGEK